MADLFVPYKACRIGFALQDAQGEAAATPTVVYPLPEAGSGINPLNNYTFFSWADNNYGVSRYMSEGKWNEGTIVVPVIPGYTLADDSDQVLYTWCFERAAAEYYYDTYWATIWRDLGHVVELYADCKCVSGSIRNAAGNFMALEMSITGITVPSEPASFPDVDVVTTDPYVFNQAAVSMKLGGGDYATDSYSRDITMNFDNRNASPSDMLTKRASAYPVGLPSFEKTRWSGTIDRAFINPDIYADFKSGQEGALKEVWTADTAAVTIEFPRVVWTEDPIGIPTEDFVKEDSLAWQGLASADGATDAFSIDETV